MMRTLNPSWLKVLAVPAVAFLLSSIFMLYRQPDFLVNLANQAWGCF